MVLEENNNQQDASRDTPFSESLPSNDADPYAGDRSPTVLSTRDPTFVAVNSPPYQVYVNLNNVPKLWSFFPSGSSYAPPLVKAIQESCKQASGLLGRPVRQEEADALAYHFGRASRIASYGAPAGMAVASAVAYRGISKFKFPGWTPGEKFNPDKFGPLTGQRARLVWQGLRFNIYWFIGAMAGSIFFSSYALTVGSAGRMMDPRLKELSEVIQSRTKRALPGNREVDQTAGPRDGETMDMARQRQRAQQAQEAWARRRDQRPAPKQDDDMSPTGGAFGAEYVDLGSAHVTDTGMMSDDQARRSSEQLEAKQRADYASRTEPQRTTPTTQRREQSSPGASGHTPARASGSAWERLRQQAASGNQSQATSRGRETPSSGDSFAFSSRDEDKHLARSEAQKEFDARIEQEREGKDFDDRSSGRKRW